jgi:cystathionine beta-lyase
MDYSFDKLIPREDTACYKYDWREKVFGNGEVIPMWVADMDFATPPFVLEAIGNRLKHPVLGYSFRPESTYQSIINWLQRRHRWNVEKEWVGFTPGVVPALNFAILALTEPGDKVIIQTPVYFPFYSAVRDHNRELVLNPLVLENGRYSMDFAQLRSAIDSRTKVLILCSPHNPTGNVWRESELRELAAICLENNITIISDEIHADVVYPGNKHIPTAILSKEIADITLTLMAPSKTFNFAGLATSFMISSNAGLLKKVSHYSEKLHVGMGNIFGNIAMEAAFDEGDEWLEELIGYLTKNVSITREFINNEMPGVHLIEPESTFLLWIDFRELRIPHKKLVKLMIDTAGLGLSDGRLFGTDGEGFQRMNIGCTSAIVEEAMLRMKRALFS